MGTYRIFYEQELLAALPEDVRERKTLEAALKSLLTGGYIDVKYARGNAFCIRAEKPYPPLKEQVEIHQNNGITYCAAALVCSALGSVIGGGVVALITAFIC